MGLISHVEVAIIRRQQGEAGTGALKQMVVIANTLNTDLSGAERLAREYRTSIGGAPPCDLTITPISTKPRLTQQELHELRHPTGGDEGDDDEDD